HMAVGGTAFPGGGMYGGGMSTPPVPATPVSGLTGGTTMPPAPEAGGITLPEAPALPLPPPLPGAPGAAGMWPPTHSPPQAPEAHGAETKRQEGAVLAEMRSGHLTPPKRFRGIAVSNTRPPAQARRVPISIDSDVHLHNQGVALCVAFVAPKMQRPRGPVRRLA